MFMSDIYVVDAKDCAIWYAICYVGEGAAAEMVSQQR